jgi:hypothetical protein
MPIVVTPHARSSVNLPKSQSLLDAARSGNVKGYRYPGNLKLKPGEKLHDMIRDEVMARVQQSHAEMSGRFDSWNKVDEQLTAYIDLSAYDKDDEGRSVANKVTGDPNKPVSIVVPVSYAILETLLTHLVTAFLDQPMFQYNGTGPEDVIGAMLMEHVIKVQTQKSRMAANVHTMFRDALVYGIGPASPQWTTKHGYRRKGNPTGFFSQIRGFVQTGMSRERERVVKFEGNELHNISPYNYFPDTSVSADETERMEYVGYVRRENKMEALVRENGDETYFNGRYLEFISGRSIYGTDNSKTDRDGVRQDWDGGEKNEVDTIYMYITLIPRDWGLGKSEVPEDWLFGVAGDQVVTAAAPVNLDHGQKPVICYAPDYDGYSAAPISKMEMSYGMQHLANFMFNSHVANVRKALNDMLVVDPTLINVNDVLNPSPAKVIRLRKNAWGKGVQGAVDQLKITDVTSRHIDESMLIMQLAQNFSGATDSLSGAPRRTSERVSATEFKGNQMAALSRLEKAARVAGFQVWLPLGEQIASNTQQLMSQDTWVEIVGRHEDDLREMLQIPAGENRVGVEPDDLLINYDVMVNDGSLPNQGDPQLWAQVFQTVAQQPVLAQQLNVVNIFKHWARLSGAPNVSDFLIKGQPNILVLPDEEVAAQAEAGNAVPLEEVA